METLPRRPIQLLKHKDNTIVALCEDGTMWVSRVTFNGGFAYSAPCMWKRLNDIPSAEEFEEAG